MSASNSSAMLTNIIPRPNGASPNQPVSEIKTICAEHSIACGSPDSLAQFLRALPADKHLAMEFWALVAGLTSERSGHSAKSDWLLATVVEGITGQTLADARASSPTQQQLVRELAAMLAGEDLQVPTSPPPSAFSGHTDRPRLVLKPETLFAAAMDRSLHEREPERPLQGPEPSIAIPLAAYAEENSRPVLVSRRLVGGLLLAAAAAAAGLLILRYTNPAGWQRLGDATRQQFASVIAVFHPHSQAPSASSARSPGHPDQATFVPTPLPAAAPVPQPVAATLNPEPAAPKSAEPAAPKASTSAASAKPEAEPHAETQVVVPAPLMKQNLISSRVPLYPDGAHGTVVIQAIVTARGTVEPVNAISGDPELREAAMAAAATWHYRPYLLNGTPVDVSTTISVNDTGND